MADFLSLGEMLIDFTPAGRTPAGIPLFEQNPGGAPANVAVQAARLGVSAGFIGKVGRDMFGAFLQQTLEQNGVETANLRFSAEASTSLAFVQLSESGDRDFSFYRDPGADTQLRFEEVDKMQLDGAKVLCFGSLLLTAEPGRTAVPQIVEYARAHGVITAYDPNWRAPLWPDRATGVRAMRSLLPLADVVKVSDEELEMLTDCAEIPAGAAALFARGVQAVVRPGALHVRHAGRGYDRLRRQLFRRVPHEADRGRTAGLGAFGGNAVRGGGLCERRRLGLRDEKGRDPGAAGPRGDRSVHAERAEAGDLTKKGALPNAETPLVFLIPEIMRTVFRLADSKDKRNLFFCG